MKAGVAAALEMAVFGGHGKVGVLATNGEFGSRTKVGDTVEDRGTNDIVEGRDAFTGNRCFLLKGTGLC
jgi:hypothetical protein